MPQNTNTENVTQGPKQGQNTATQGQGAKPAKPKKEKKAAAPKEPKAPRVKKEKAEKPARETPAHMAKVEKIAAGLPALSGDANTLFAAMKNLATADLNGILAHLSVEIRRRGVLAAVASGTAASNGQLKEGMRVQIRSGNPRFISQQGTVAKVQRIRCYVRLDGRDKDDYFFIDDVQPLQGNQGQVVTASSLAETVTRLTSNPPVIQGQGAIHALVDEEENGNESQAATG